MRRLCLLAPLALAACATAPADSVVAEPAQTCRNDAMGTFVGQPASQDLGARMLAASGARAIRWVAKGMMVTMDYRGDRLTVRLDAVNRVESLSCG